MEPRRIPLSAPVFPRRQNEPPRNKKSAESKLNTNTNTDTDLNKELALEKFISPKEELLWTSKTRPFPLLELPVDILVMSIMPHLPLSAQVCLAFTCKPLHQILRYVLRDERLSWPGVVSCLMDYKLVYMGQRPAEKPSALLLYSLENSRWTYCRRCMKLHRNEDFFYRRSFPGMKLRRTCRYKNGISEPCACLAVNAADGELVTWLKQGGPSEKLRRGLRETLPLEMHDKRPVLVHGYRLTGCPRASISAAMTVALEKGDCLTVTTKYQVQWKEERAWDRAEPLRSVLEELRIVPWIDIDYGMKSGGPLKHAGCVAVYEVLTVSRDGRSWVIESKQTLGKLGRWYNRRIYQSSLRKMMRKKWMKGKHAE